MTNRDRTPRYGIFPGVWFRRDSPLSSTERLVLCVISLHNQKDSPGSYPSVDLIAAESGLGTTATRAALRRLEDLGAKYGHVKAIERVKYPGRPSTYRILHLDWKQDVGVPWVTKHPNARRCPPEKKRQTPTPGVGGATAGDTDPNARRPGIKGVNSTFNNSSLRTGAENVDNATPLASALDAPRGAAPGAIEDRPRTPWRSRPITCIGCGATLNQPDGSPDVHADDCRINAMAVRSEAAEQLARGAEQG